MVRQMKAFHLLAAGILAATCSCARADDSAGDENNDATPMVQFPIIHTAKGDIPDDPALDECYDYVLMSTTKGDIVLELHHCAAPKTVDNFLQYVDDGFYDDTLFHRVENGFVIQGGAYKPDFTPKTARDPIPCEWPNGLKNVRGTIAMARATDPNSATSQFFINLRQSVNLDGPNKGGMGHCVFGRVVEGMNVVDQIGVAQTIRKPDLGDVQTPIDPIQIIQVGRILGDEAKALADKNREARLAMEVAGYRERAEVRWKADNREHNTTLTDEQRVQQGIEYVKKQGWDITKGVLLPSGVWYVDDRVGVGDCPKIDDWVAMKWDGWLSWGEKFGSWEDYKHEPMRGPVRGFVPGYREALLTMKPGGVRVVVIPSKLAYAEVGREPLIPKNAAVVYRIEMLGVLPANEDIPVPAPQAATDPNDAKDKAPE